MTRTYASRLSVQFTGGTVLSYQVDKGGVLSIDITDLIVQVKYSDYIMYLNLNTAFWWQSTALPPPQAVSGLQ